MKLKMLPLDWKSLGITEVAVDLLKEKYVRKELMINTHNLQLHDFPIVSTHYEKLRSTYDHIEQHLRSLEALGENTCNI